MKSFADALKVLLLMTILTGVIYPLVITGLGQVLFPGEARGSIVSRNGHIVGSALVGQKFTDPKYFRGRPSATGYNPLPSSGSNLGPTSAALKDLIATRLADFKGAHGNDATPPADLLCASGSGLDPHISPEAAQSQLRRIAEARHFDAAGVGRLSELINKHIEQPQWSLFGEARVNVLVLNLALDSLR